MLSFEINPSEFYRTVDWDLSYGYLRSHEHNKSHFFPYLTATRSQAKPIWRQMKDKLPPKAQRIMGHVQVEKLAKRETLLTENAQAQQ